MSDIYQKAINILTSQGKFYIELGLERVQEYLNLIGNPQNKLRIIHVAGTNGKGSVCAMLNGILRQTGLKTGIYTSPHIFNYTERIKINDIEISQEDFANLVIKTVERAEAQNIHLTEFEILTIIAFEYFARNNVEMVLLETGLGGRLDATNVIKKNLMSIITHIDFDHTERLGNTIYEIASEKAGIIKENCPVIISKKNSGLETIKNVAKGKNSKIIYEDTETEEFNNEIPKGTYQKENFSLVLSAINQLKYIGVNINETTIKQGLKQFHHPCRFEIIEDKKIIIDGAHNPNGIDNLRKSLDEYFPNQSFNFIFGCLRHKNYPEMMKRLFTPKDKIYFYHFNNRNSATIDELKSACEFSSKSFEEFQKDDKIITVICGSFYMLSEISSKMGIK